VHHIYFFPVTYTYSYSYHTHTNIYTTNTSSRKIINSQTNPVRPTLRIVNRCLHGGSRYCPFVPNLFGRNTSPHKYLYNFISLHIDRITNRKVDRKPTEHTVRKGCGVDTDGMFSEQIRVKVSRKTMKCSITAYLEFQFNKSTIINAFAPVWMIESKAKFRFTQRARVLRT